MDWELQGLLLASRPCKVGRKNRPTRSLASPPGKHSRHAGCSCSRQLTRDVILDRLLAPNGALDGSAILLGNWIATIGLRRRSLRT